MNDIIDFASRQPSFQITCMPAPTPLEAPTEKKKCANCRHWLSQYEKRLVLTNMGPMPLDQLMAQGGLHEHLIKSAFTGAPCVVLPKYELTPEYHWCGQFSLKD